MNLIKFLTKPQCQLCVPAFNILQNYAVKYSFKIEIINILDSEEFNKYKYDIPVILHHDRVIAKGIINEDELKKELERLFFSQICGIQR